MHSLLAGHLPDEILDVADVDAELPVGFLLLVQLPKAGGNVFGIDDGIVVADNSSNVHARDVDALRTQDLVQTAAEVELRRLLHRQREKVGDWVVIEATVAEEKGRTRAWSLCGGSSQMRRCPSGCHI